MVYIAQQIPVIDSHKMTLLLRAVRLARPNVSRAIRPVAAAHARSYATASFDLKVSVRTTLP